MEKTISLLLVIFLFLSGTVFATSLEEISSLKITKQNQSQYNIEVDVSFPTDIEGQIVENAKSRVVNLKVPKKINGKELSNINIFIKQKGYSSPYLSTRIAFDKDHKDVNAFLSFFNINIEVINYTSLTVYYEGSENIYEIDLNSYIRERPGDTH